MYITWDTIITAGAVASALLFLGGLIIKVYKRTAKVKALEDEVASIKKEDALLCFALSACLDGLMQLGANHTVPIAKEKLDKHLNQSAHKVGGDD